MEQEKNSEWSHFEALHGGWAALSWQGLMHPLLSLIRSEIRGMGSISFERFMELALYHPEHGYYRRPTQRIGRAGDFMTSVSTGPLFGRLLARQFLDCWERMDRPARFSIVEQGAENDTLANDILDWCQKRAPEFFLAIHYTIIGTPGAQNESFSVAEQFQGKIKWAGSLAETAVEAGVFFSNELVDAMPVHRVIFRQGCWCEWHVSLDEKERLVWTEKDIADKSLRRATADLPQVEGYTTEINLRARSWMKELGRHWPRGYVFTFDYGFTTRDYYALQRSAGTLTAYRRHGSSGEVLSHPGEQDLTAHVDFSALARAGEESGLAVLGFIDQQHFLTGVAHDELAGTAKAPTGIQENLRAWQTLTHPQYLGARFRVLVQGRQVPGGLIGLRYAREDSAL